jgi:hypothetical protein
MTLRCDPASWESLRQRYEAELKVRREMQAENRGRIEELQRILTEMFGEGKYGQTA